MNFLSKSEINRRFNALATSPLPAAGRPKEGGNYQIKKELFTQTVKQENPKNLWGMYLNEFSDLNPSYINHILETSRKGMDFYISLLFDNIRRKDLHIGGVLQIRKAAIAKRRWDIYYPEDSKVPESKQKEIIYFVKQNLKKKFVRFLMNAVEANISGSAFFELNFKPSRIKGAPGSATVLDTISYIPGHNVLFDDITNQYYFMSKDKMDAFLLNSYSAAGYSQDRIPVADLSLPVISPYKIVSVFGVDGSAQNAFLNGCRIGLIWAYFFKNYGVKDFASFIEQHGIPPILASYDPLMNDQEKSSLWNAIQEWGHIFKMMFPNTAKIEFLESAGKQATAQIFTDYIKGFWDEAISIRAIGNVLTHSAGSSTGSYAQAKVQDLVREDIAYFDMIAVEPGANDLIEKLIKLNYGELDEYPEFHWEDDANLEYQKLRSEVLLNIKNMGYRPLQEDVEKEFEVAVEPAPEQSPTPEPLPEGEGRFRKKFTVDNYIEKVFNEIEQNSERYG